jgi:hypothetical protein
VCVELELFMPKTVISASFIHIVLCGVCLCGMSKDLYIHACGSSSVGFVNESSGGGAKERDSYTVLLSYVFAKLISVASVCHAFGTR